MILPPDKSCISPISFLQNDQRLQSKRKLKEKGEDS